MPEPQHWITKASVIVAVLSVGWAIYATNHAGEPDEFAGGSGMGAPGGRPQPGGAGQRPAVSSGGADRAGVAAGRSGGAGGMGGAGSGGMPAAIVTAPVRAERIVQQLKALGTARANEAIEVTSKISNVISAVRFRDGQRVQRGQVLVELDSAQARAELAEAQAALAESESLYNRSRELLATQAVSKSQLEQLEATLKGNSARVAAASARLEDTVIRAPFAGRVGLRRVSVGSLVNPGATITTLDDTSVMKVDFSVPENFVGTLREGLSLTATASAFADLVFEGRVASVDSRVDANTRSVTVRALVPNPDGLLRPGMFLNVTLAKDERDALVIPEEALVPEQNRQYVFVVADGKAARREVRIGRRDPGRVEIVAGLDRGERVIVEGTQRVRDGAPVRDLRDSGAAPPAMDAGQPARTGAESSARSATAPGATS
jgi:membrane fusion protein (multidrug efflux system)